MTRAPRAAARPTSSTQTTQPKPQSKPAKPTKPARTPKTPPTSRTWVPERGDVIWIDCNPQVGRQMRDMHPMLVLSPKAFNARTSIVIGLPMTSSLSNLGNPFALEVPRETSKGMRVNGPRVEGTLVKGTREPSFVLCHQPKSVDWRQRRASPHPWKSLTNAHLAAAFEGLNDIVGLTGS